MEFDKLEPFGDVRANWHAAQIAWILASAYSDPKRPKPRIDDFIWTDEQTRRERQELSVVNFFRAAKRSG